MELPVDPRDPVHNDSPPELFWTTTNAGEAMPGIQTPLSYTVWADAGRLGFEGALRAMGVLGDSEPLPAPPVHGFYGRGVMSVEVLRMIGDRMSGATGEQVVSGMIGFVPEGMTFAPTRRYAAAVARRFPATFVRVPSMLRAFVPEQDAWWRRSAFEVAGFTDKARVRAFLSEAFERHERATVTQCIAVFGGVQPVHDAIEQAAARFGADYASVLTSPVGGAEMEVVADIWRASRGALSVEDVARRHGFHGPVEGEIASRVWRDDPTPLDLLVSRYRARPDREDPALAQERRIAVRASAERAFLAGVPVAARPAVRGLLALGRKRLHLRGVCKRSMLQGFDGIRAGARRLGDLLAADGRLDRPDDIFYLTKDELRRPSLPADARALVDLRRERHALYAQWALPVNFAGVPSPLRVSETAAPDPARTVITGIGVSAGIVEGSRGWCSTRASATSSDGEVLIAPTTDPSWSSVMFISAGLVVDIGGALSHAAVVARELGIPCVVNTLDGTAQIRTGDRVRVDGRAGTVEILARAA